MPETVLFEIEQKENLAAVAAYLRTVADNLESGGTVTLESGGESVTLDPPETVEFEVKAEREGPTDGEGELSLELEIEWDEHASGDGDSSLSIS
jgi:amphi-Trp domain-containing protein